MTTNWRPSASIDSLRERHFFYQKIRAFFEERGILEVQTPILSQFSGTDVFIESFQTTYTNQNEKKTYFLQTSPEYHMKRLLAEGIGSIFQITRAFRNEGEFGQEHNPEFSMLEWYHIGFDHHALMQEVSDLLQILLNCKPAEKISYQALFLQYLDICPHTSSIETLQKIAAENNLFIVGDNLSQDVWLQLLLSHLIEPKLGFSTPLFIYDYPATQAALAKIREDEIPVAERFEVYIQGKEVGNGFHELSDPEKQKARFLKDQEKRKNNHQFVPDIDVNFLAALEAGLPPCAGIAMGLDRLLQIHLNKSVLREVLPFAWDIA